MIVNWNDDYMVVTAAEDAYKYLHSNQHISAG